MAISNAVMGGTSYWAARQIKPRAIITVGVPRYKNWPRDCSVICSCKIQLNASAEENNYIVEITQWLRSLEIEYEWLDSRTFILNSIEDVTMFKLAWSELLNS